MKTAACKAGGVDAAALTAARATVPAEPDRGDDDDRTIVAARSAILPPRTGDDASGETVPNGTTLPHGE